MWIDAEMAAELLEISSRHLRRSSEKYNVREIPSSRNTKKYEVELESLPIEAQKKYYDEVLRSAKNDPSAPEDTLESLYFRYGKKWDQKLQSALKKQEIILQAQKCEHGEKSESFAALAKAYGVSTRSISRWISDYEQDGIAGLIRKPRTDAGMTSLTDEEIVFIQGAYLQPIRPKMTHIYKIYVQKAVEMGWDVVSLSSVKRAIKDIPAEMKILAHEGVRKYRASCMPKITRSYEDLLVNEYWVGDGHTLAIWTPKDGRVMRYTFSAWMDMRSRAITGYAIAKHSNSEVIAAALVSGIRGFGAVANLYMDNGKDYRSKYLNAGMADSRYKFLQDYEGIFKALNIGTTYATPYHPWAKPIERFFQTFSSELSRYIVGYCGETIEERPHNLNKEDILVYGIGIEEVEKLIAGYIEQYNHRAQSALKGKSPMEIIEETDHARSDIISDAELDILMLRVDKRKITASGIKMFGVWYWHDELYKYYNRDCVLRYDPRRRNELYVYVDGKRICIAEHKQSLSMRSSGDEIGVWRKLQRQAEKEVKEAIRRLGVTQDEVRRRMLSEYVDEETATEILASTNKATVKKGKIKRLNKHTIEAKQLEEERIRTERENAGTSYFEKLGEQYIKEAK